MQMELIKDANGMNIIMMLRYYSKEHEDLSYTAFKIFQKNIFTGSGIKIFIQYCNTLKMKKINIYIKKDYQTKNTKKKFITLDRNNLRCSTHPHNTYFQIL